jgi:hypothetical protein
MEFSRRDCPAAGRVNTAMQFHGSAKITFFEADKSTTRATHTRCFVKGAQRAPNRDNKVIECVFALLEYGAQNF